MEMELTTQLISVPTKTPTKEPKYIITNYAKTTRTNPPTETPIKIITISIQQ